MTLPPRAAWLLPPLLMGYVLAASHGNWALIWPGCQYRPAWIPGLSLSLLALLAWTRFRRTSRPWPTPVEVLSVIALTAAIATDLTQIYQPLRDLGIYLKAGERFLQGSAVYMQAPMTQRPTDLTNYPFLYPPLALPLFAALARLPRPLAQFAWAAGSCGLVLAALREIGVSRRWLLLALLWPPLFQGLWVGNVSVPSFALFAFAPRFGAGLVLGGIFKSHTGIATLWLVRERRWRALVGGVVGVALAVLLTLPLTGLSAWSAWFQTLHLYKISQQNVPVLYGFGLAKVLPFWLLAILAAAAILGALSQRGKIGLARFGTAIIVASPSLWGHGLLLAVPSLLLLRPVWLWATVAVTCAPDGLPWWAAVVTILVSWFVPGMNRAAGQGVEERPFPADDRTAPWPGFQEKARG